MTEERNEPQVYRGHTITDSKKIKFSKKKPGLLVRLIDECHKYYAGNLHGWIMAKLWADPTNIFKNTNEKN